jgi:hypothetical protein
MWNFIKGLYLDPRIPKWDRNAILIMLFLVIWPADIIPDWIPVIGVLDDLFWIALIGDYLFRVLDPEITLGRWPYGLKSYQSVKRFLTAISNPIPKGVRNFFWRYKSSPYRMT